MARGRDSLKTSDLAATHHHLENVWGAWVAYLWESTTFLACRSCRSCSLIRSAFIPPCGRAGLEAKMKADRGSLGLHDPLRQAWLEQTGYRGQGPGLALPWPWQRLGSYSRFAIPSGLHRTHPGCRDRAWGRPGQRRVSWF